MGDDWDDAMDRYYSDWGERVGATLADASVRGVRVDVVPLVAGPPPSLAQTWVAEFDEDYPRLVSDWVTEQVLTQMRAQERRGRNTAMLLWGVHR